MAYLVHLVLVVLVLLLNSVAALAKRLTPPSTFCVYLALNLVTFFTDSQVRKSIYSNFELISHSTFSLHGGVVKDPVYLVWQPDQPAYSLKSPENSRRRR